MAQVQQVTQTQQVEQINLQYECHHRHGPLFLLQPWAWGGPCRRCERMQRNVVVVPANGANGVVTVNSRVAQPVVMTNTTTTTRSVPAQQVVYGQPPNYTETVIVN
ncbi:uncharacterized protein LOC116805265 [Drosophila grimshawi]|uniref:uncharacterized protein LOC116805265 n=1 Tax=Drosophila grimshawi TaxID=7222 RepID=UPI000C87034B|nr:uncharacterized protein LOC116805265 [Drosophila grimshawi]